MKQEQEPVQGPAIHGGDYPVGGPLVPAVPIRYRDPEQMLADRGIQVDHTTLFRWIQTYASELGKRTCSHLRLTNGSWRMEETYIRVKGRRVYLYRAVDAVGQAIDFLLSRKRDAAAACRFFLKALKQSHTVNPRTITVDKDAAYPIAAKTMKRDGDLWRFAKLRQVKSLNNIVEQDHWRIKRLVRPGLGFKNFQAASQAIAGYEAMAMMRKGQVAIAPANDMRDQRDFSATLVGAAGFLAGCSCKA